MRTGGKERLKNIPLHVFIRHLTTTKTIHNFCVQNESKNCGVLVSNFVLSKRSFKVDNFKDIAVKTSNTFTCSKVTL